MTEYHIPTADIMENDTGTNIRVIEVGAPTNGEVLLGSVSLSATTVIYTPPPMANTSVTEDCFGYTITDDFGQLAQANVYLALANATTVGNTTPTANTSSGCGFNVLFQGTFDRASEAGTKLQTASGAQVGDFAIVSYVKYHRGNTDDFIDTGWTKLQYNGIPQAYESGLYCRVLTQEDCDLISGAGLPLCTDADAASLADPYQRQVAGFAFVVRTHNSWDQAYQFYGDYDRYGADGNWASTQGDVGSAIGDYQSYTMYGPSVEFHFVHACDFYEADNGVTKPDPANRTSVVPAFGPMIDNKWGISTYSIIEYDQGEQGRNIPVPSYHITNSSDSFYNRVRLNFPTCN